MTDPTRWTHARDCTYHPLLGTGVCTCGLSVLRNAVASGDPIAVLEVLGMRDTLAVTSPAGEFPRTYVVRPLPDTPEVSP